MKNITKLVGVLILALLAYFLFLRSPEDKAGELAPEFQAELINGEKFELKQLRGNYVLLDFWGSWCGPCRRENPALGTLYEQFKDSAFTDAEGFEIVTVALEKGGDAWRRVAEKDGFVWPYQIVQKAKVVIMAPIAQKYAVSNIPAKFLIDPGGRVIGVNQSMDEIHEFLTSKTTKH